MSKYFILLFFILFLISCGDSKAANETIDEYFKLIKDQNFEEALKLYSDSFFKKIPKEEWLKTLNMVHEKLGNYVSHIQTGWKSNSFAGTNGIKHTIQYTMSVEYSEYKATETLTIQNFGDVYRIAGHHITSRGLQETS